MLSSQTDCENVNWYVRNHDGGFIFQRENINPPQGVLEAATQTLEAVGLDFGAVDIGWNERYQAATVYEINTAPGIEGTTATDYANALSLLVMEREADAAV